MRRKSTFLLAILLLCWIEASAGPRTDGMPQGPLVGAVVAPCGLTSPVISLGRGSTLERRWRDLEKPLRSLLATELMSQEALASLEQRVLAQHDWTLTRYLVRALRELKAPDLRAAERLLRLDGYAEQALRDAAWDGLNGWDVVSAVRAETLQILDALERQRSAGQSEQAVVERLLQAASEREPYAVGSTCTQRRD